jgi:hypothetical protein
MILRKARTRKDGRHDMRFLQTCSIGSKNQKRKRRAYIGIGIGSKNQKRKRSTGKVKPTMSMQLKIHMRNDLRYLTRCFAFTYLTTHRIGFGTRLIQGAPCARIFYTLLEPLQLMSSVYITTMLKGQPCFPSQAASFTPDIPSREEIRNKRSLTRSSEARQSLLKHQRSSADRKLEIKRRKKALLDRSNGAERAESQTTRGVEEYRSASQAQRRNKVYDTKCGKGNQTNNYCGVQPGLTPAPELRQRSSYRKYPHAV